MRFPRVLFLVYAVSLISLFFYSFTQVDLSLTLSQASFYQATQKGLQYVGFFQRQTSAFLFIAIIGVLFILYLFSLAKARINKLDIKLSRNLVLLAFGALVLSYNAFSYDLFNYIFDAKIITFYGQNPYLHTPADFGSDPMLNFMRWTHRFYPYGPSWLILTVPLAFAGLNIFLLTFFFFKIMIGLTYIGSCYLIYKISEIVFPKEKLFNTLFFALNPLVLIEGLVSAHNDFPLVFFCLLGIYLYLAKRKFFGVISYIFSVGIKYSTIILAPLFAYVVYLEKTKKKINWEKIFLVATILSALSIVIASTRTTFQPWYLIFPISMASFISKKYFIFIPAFVATTTALAIYTAYVLLTDYSVGYPQIVLNIELLGLTVAILTTLLYGVKLRMFDR